MLEDCVDSLGGETQELTACIESMSDKLCYCHNCVEVESFIQNMPTPALMYEGSENSYHTLPPAGIIGKSPVCPPLVELSSRNDSNQENVRPSSHMLGIPAGSVLVTISSDIELWNMPVPDFEEAEAFSDEMEKQRRRRAYGLPVFSIGRQTCIKSKQKRDPYSHHRAVGEHKQCWLCYITSIGASKHGGQDLKSSEWATRKLECGYGGYKSDRESSLSSLSNADAWEFHQSNGSNLSPRNSPRAAPLNHNFVQPLTRCCSGGSPGQGAVGAACQGHSTPTLSACSGLVIGH